jgi:hypothetical protein
MGNEIKKYCNFYGWSDREPYEVIQKVSEKCVEIRAMKYTRDESEQLKYQVGGFSAHCINQDEQKWIIESDETMPITRARLNKKGYWMSNYGKHIMSDRPLMYYDFNF